MRLRLLILGLTGLGCACMTFILAGHIRDLDSEIQTKFNGKKWSIPAVVYARPPELYVGQHLQADDLEEELLLAGYRKEHDNKASGGYTRSGDIIRLITREFVFTDGRQPAEPLTITFDGQVIKGIHQTDSNRALTLVRLDPARIGSFLPENNEDRILLKREDLPDLLVQTLLQVEDRNFYHHHGVDPRGIIRALLVNIRAGTTVAGGSTLTQQLVKNFFLTSERTLQRKFNEAIMAILLERRYSKDEILTAYTNEIFLGQEGRRAVHGFGLASQFYFRRDLDELEPAQVALLVAMVKGPSYFNPRKHPQRCLDRRNTVLAMMLEGSLLNEKDYRHATDEPILSASTPMSGFNRFPAFLDLVRRQLRQHYQKEDLTSDGLKIITTLDPRIQFTTETQLDATLTRLEKKTGIQDLESAAVVTDRNSGEVLALAGSRIPMQGSFNRALDARRPIGSLIKPAIYLTGLVNGYTLASPLEDKRIRLKDRSGETWIPHNYDRKEHGRVMFYKALANSYNLAAARLGLTLGVEQVQETLARLGVERRYPPYPSFLLGTAEMTPFEVTGMYQTLASGGFHITQRAITAVLSQDNSILERNGLTVEQRFPREPIFLINFTLQQVVQEGTAHALQNWLPPHYQVAGKTGTSNDLRDSWFAGFTGNRVGVVWIGRDNNKPTGLTGSSGAMPVWAAIMNNINTQPLKLTQPLDIGWVTVDHKTFREISPFDKKGKQLPFIGRGQATSSTRGNRGQGERPSTSVLGGLEKMVDSFFSIFR